MAGTGSKVRGIVLEIGGDTSKLVQALDQVDRQISGTTSKLREVDKLLKLDPKNIDLINQKYNYLKTAISDTEAKLRGLKDVQSQAIDSGVDIQSENYKELKRQIVQTEQQLLKFKNAQTETISTIEDLAGKTGLLTSEKKKLAKETKNSTEATEKQNKKLKENAKRIATAIASVTAAIAILSKMVKEITNLAKESASAAKEIEKLSKQTRLSTDEVQELSYVAEICGVSLDTITKTVKQSLKSIKEASKYNWDYMEGYQALGIEIRDANGQLRDSNEIYWETITALREMEESTQRDIIAETLLGRKASELNEIFSLTNEQFDALIQEAHDIGYVLDSETVESLANLDSSFIKAQKSIEALKNRLTASLAPALVETSEFLSDFIANFEKVFTGKYDWLTFDLIGEQLYESIKNGFVTLIQNLPKLAGGLINIAFDLVNILIDALGDVDWLTLVVDLLDVIAKTILVKLPETAMKLVESAVEIIFGLIGDLFTGDFWKRFGKFGLNIGIALVNGLLDGIESGINSMMKGLEKLLKVFNITLPKVNLPKIPMLAKGGILSSGSAIVGEAGPELLTNVGGRSVVQPLTANVNTQQLAQAMQSAGGNQIIQINFTGSLSQLAKILEPEIKIESTRIGASLIG